jgi:O-antigen/teichoic acid export membrane protein
MSGNKIIVKNSFVLYIRLFLTSIISLFSIRYILIALGASDFGLYTVVGGIVFLMAFLNNVMVSTTHRFIAYELGTENKENVNKVFNISLIIHVFLAVLTVFLAETGGVYYIEHYLNIPDNKVSDALFVFRLSILSSIFSILSIPYQGLITAKENFTVSASIEIIRSVLSLCAVMFVFYLPSNQLRVYTSLVTIISLFPPIFYFIYSKKNYFELTVFKFQRDRLKYKEMIEFSIWILIGAAAIGAETKISEIIVNVFFGTILNAAFGLATNVNIVLKTFAQSLNRAIIPQITKSYSSGNFDRTLELVIFSSKYSFFLLLIPAVPILLETNFILGMWLGKVPDYTIIFVQLMVINSIIQVMDSGIPALVHATGKIKYFQIILSSIHLLALPAAFLFLKAGFGPYMMIIPFTVSALINLGLEQFLLKKLINFNVKLFLVEAYLKMFLVLIPISFIFIIHQMFDPGFFRFLFFSISSIIFILFFVYFLGLSPKERDFLNFFIKNKYILIQKKWNK